MAGEKMVVHNATDPEKSDSEKEDDENEQLPDDTDQEWKSLNEQIDDLNLVLDNLESQNDEIYKEFLQLLKSNREARQQFQNEINQPTNPSTTL